MGLEISFSGFFYYESGFINNYRTIRIINFIRGGRMQFFCFYFFQELVLNSCWILKFDSPWITGEIWSKIFQVVSNLLDKNQIMVGRRKDEVQVAHGKIRD